MHAALKKIMLTEARDKGSLLGGDIGEGPSTLLECLPVEKNLQMVFTMAPIKLDHEDILPLLKNIMRPCMTELNEKLKNGMALLLSICHFSKTFVPFK